MPSVFLGMGPLALLLTLSLTGAASTARAQGPLTLDADGLSGISAATPFDIAALRDTGPKVAWTRAARPTEDGAQATLVARRRGGTLFTLIGDGRGRIAAIEITSRRVHNRLGPRVGDTYAPLDAKGQVGACSPGTEALSGAVICQAAQTDRIAYVFSGPSSGPDGQMPLTIVLNDWTLSQILWRPDRFAQIGPPPAPWPQAGPAFDCAKASGTVEQLICDTADLARLDRHLNDLYAERRATLSPADQNRLRAEQIGWIKARNECWKSSDTPQCVADLYTDRIAELGSEATSLPATSWKGLRIAGDTLPGGIDITLTFEPDGKVTGTSGCNRFFATYALNGPSLGFGPIGSTRRLCPEIQMLAERRFLDALERVNGWALQDGNLVLFGAGAELAFRPL